MGNIVDFMSAALPWIAVGLLLAIFFVKTARGKKKKEKKKAENAWIPILADGYMYIDCLWVSGSFKGHGYSNDLLDACINDSKSKGKSGLKAIHLENKEQAQNAPTPITTYALFRDGAYLTNEQMNDTKFLKLVAAQS